MARPQVLQFLRKGSLLVGKVFPNFVATWNWLVGAFDSMVGDGDIDPKNGAINIDRTNPDRPIIRLNAMNVKGGGDGGSQAAESWTYGRFSLVRDEESGTFSFKDTYYMSGGYIKSINADNAYEGINCLVIPCGVKTYEESPHIRAFSSPEAFFAFSEDENYFVCPLFTISTDENGRQTVELDWRIGPLANMWESA